MTQWMPDLTEPEVARRLDREVVFLPLGALEQHGPHLPLDTDTVVPTRVALAVAERIDGLVAPGIPYGYRSQPTSGGGELFRGTTSLSGATLTACVRDVVSSLARHAQREIILVNGHMENSYFAVEGINLALGDPLVPDLRAVLVNWWDLPGDDDLDELFDGAFPGWAAEHAGIIETSLMLHLQPERVRADLIEDRISTTPVPRYTLLPERPGLVDPSGVLRTARGSSAALGRRLFACVVDEIEAIVTSELRKSPHNTSDER
jgi:creatinine amidohydrolase